MPASDCIWIEEDLPDTCHSILVALAQNDAVRLQQFDSYVSDTRRQFQIGSRSFDFRVPVILQQAFDVPDAESEGGSAEKIILSFAELQLKQIFGSAQTAVFDPFYRVAGLLFRNFFPFITVQRLC